ncbi:ATP-binding protein [Streptomyces sp. NPDC101490]|uniref:ATP-binding protein n=1 Tax=Streptomyces sp. NPDC101490 TaxID=3366143 RepID=UPI0037FC12AC
MKSADGCVVRKPWELSFLAEPRELAALRRLVRLHLKLWGLSPQSDTAQLCVSELVSRVIRQGGAGTPASLRFSMNGTSLRIEVRDAGWHVPSTPIAPAAEADTGLTLVEGVADRWGVLWEPEHRVTWCEISTDLTTPHGHSGDARVMRAEAMLRLYGAVALPPPGAASRLRVAATNQAVIEVIIDLLRWVDAHGYDADDILDAAQTRFEAGR